MIQSQGSNSRYSNENDYEIMVLVEGFYPHLGGGALEQWNFTRQAADEEFDVSVFTPRVEDAPKRETKEGVSIYRPFPGAAHRDDLSTLSSISKRILFNICILPYLLIRIHEKRPDIIYCPSHLLHPIAKILGVAFSIPTIQYVAYSPSLRNNSKKDIEWLLEQLNFRIFMGDLVFVRNPEIKEMINKYNSGSNVNIIDGIVDADLIHSLTDSDLEIQDLIESFNIPENATLLCWVGRVVDIKNPDAALEIIDTLPDDYHLIIAGDGPELSRIQRLAERYYDISRIHFAGRIPHKQALQLMGVSDGLLLTSNTESYPTVVFEALCLDTQVFATPVGILTELTDPALYLSDIKSLPRKIKDHSSNTTRTIRIHKANLERYRIGEFSETIIKSIRRIA
jgi:glycosyltransferase involved in cell wall biosynthesis